MTPFGLINVACPPVLCHDHSNCTYRHTRMYTHTHKNTHTHIGRFSKSVFLHSDCRGCSISASMSRKGAPIKHPCPRTNTILWGNVHRRRLFCHDGRCRKAWVMWGRRSLLVAVSCAAQQYHKTHPFSHLQCMLHLAWFTHGSQPGYATCPQASPTPRKYYSALSAAKTSVEQDMREPLLPSTLAVFHSSSISVTLALRAICGKCKAINQLFFYVKYGNIEHQFSMWARCFQSPLLRPLVHYPKRSLRHCWTKISLMEVGTNTQLGISLTHNSLASLCNWRGGVFLNLCYCVYWDVSVTKTQAASTCFVLPLLLLCSKSWKQGCFPFPAPSLYSFTCDFLPSLHSKWLEGWSTLSVSQI